MGIQRELTQFARTEIIRLNALGCIENLWSWLDGQLQKQSITNVEELKTVLTDILNNVPVKICQDLVDSMPKRISECLAEKGNVTHY